MLNKGEGRKARSLPEIVDMESVSGVSTRTEPTVSGAESSACQVPLQRLIWKHTGETSSLVSCEILPGPTNDPGFSGSDSHELHVDTVFLLPRCQSYTCEAFMFSTSPCQKGASPPNICLQLENIARLPVTEND